LTDNHFFGDSILLASYFNELYQAFQKAESTANAQDRYYKLADRVMRLRFAGPALMPYITPALEHLASKPVRLPSPTVCIWDSASTSIEFEPHSWEDFGDTALIENQDAAGEKHIRVYFKDKYTKGIYQLDTQMLSMFSMENNLGILWIPDAQKIPYYYRGSPMRSIIHWWAIEQGMLLAHAGAVGKKNGGVLLAGKSLSGKSCTAMFCLNSELDYAGDDHVLISTQKDFYLYSLYNSCKLSDADKPRFPGLFPKTSDHDNSNKEKNLLFINEIAPEKVTKGFQIRAIILPKVTNHGNTRLRQVSAPECLKSLAPSTILQLPGAGQTDLKWMAELVKRLPSFVLELGEDTQNIPKVILNLLNEYKTENV
jgi:hypothetical protein